MPIAHHVSCRPANSDNLHPAVPIQIQCNQVLDRDFPRLNQRPLPLTQLGNGRKRRERVGSRGESCPPRKGWPGEGTQQMFQALEVPRHVPVSKRDPNAGID